MGESNGVLPNGGGGYCRLQQKISEVHAQAVASYLQNLNCPKEEKIRLLNDIKSNTEK